LSEAEIEKMVKDAEANAVEDHKLRELADSRNQADALIHSSRKALADYGDKLEAGEKTKIEEAIKALEDSARGGDKADIDAKVEALSAASQKLGEKMYADMQAAQAAGDAQAAGGGAHQEEHAQQQASAKAEDDVLDAEFKEVKKD
jgi:molecular chaperone DnaK